MRRLFSFLILCVSLSAVVTQLSGCEPKGNAGSKSDSGSGNNEGGAATGGDASSGGSSGGTPTGGGSSVDEPGNLGASCKKEGECASGHCADGVCCNEACDGVCAACNGAGECVAADSDTACPAVTCSQKDNDCLDYGTELGGSCKGLGVCKTSDDCPATPKAENTACDIPGSSLGFCDGLGECTLPTIVCGGVCTVGSDVCCYRKVTGAVSFDCSSAGVCPSTTLASNPAATPVSCDDHGDCRTGHLCSLLVAAAGSGIECRSASLTNSDGANYDGVNQDNFEVCASPTMAQQTCSNTAACTWTHANFPGWKFCNH